MTAGDKQSSVSGVGVPDLDEEIFVQQRCNQKHCLAVGSTWQLKEITDHIVQSSDIGLH